MSKVFLSYSRKDETFVEDFYRRLTRDGVTCFFDKESVEWGENVVLALERAIKECEIIVPILSPDYINSEWATVERAAAMMGDPTGMKRKLRPLLLKDCDIASTFLGAISYIDISTTEKFEVNYSKICSDLGGYVWKEKNLAEKISRDYNLKEVLLVPTPHGARLYETLGYKAARYFIENVPDNSVVGISCGNTIFNMANNLKKFSRPMSVYPISFNVGPTLFDVMSPYAALIKIHEKNLSANAYYIAIPAFFSDLDLEKKVVLERKDISHLLERAYNPTSAFYSAGHLGPGSSFERASIYLREIVDPDFDYHDFENKGACGEINWYPYSITGDPIEHAITAHCSSICLERIKRLARDHSRYFVLVAGGANKIKAILGALRGQYLNVLITDIDTAKAVISLENASN